MKITYVLVTSARNEEKYIEKTIQSVIAQTILPEKWIVISDGSTDRTDDIVKQYVRNCDFIQFLHRECDPSRNFASRVYAIRAGIERLDGVEYDFLGIVDADTSFEPSYYEGLLTKFRENPKLGIAGGILLEPYGGKWVQQRTSIEWSVSGPIQMFRRQCYEDIGGLIPLRRGGEDPVAEVMARMRGWEVRTFPDMPVFHHRRTGTEGRHILLAKFHEGIRDYSYGSHPLFETAKCISRIGERPYFFGILLRWSGYSWASLRKIQRDVPDNVVTFMRREQIQRLRMALSRKRTR